MKAPVDDYTINNLRTTPVIVCLAHLGWDFVWQRPQQILSRLARHYSVLYINEPVHLPQGTTAPQLVQVAAGDGVSAWQPGMPDERAVLEQWRDVYGAMVRTLLLAEGFVQESADGSGLQPLRPLILWFYTPTPYYLLELIPADLVVYDVMDELASFHGAGADLRAREAAVLETADIVFTGGRSLYESRRDRHPHVHLFPSGVDIAHFAGAAVVTTPPSELLAGIRGPRLGYVGVIDERIDLPLLARLADTHPEWSLIMVGPIAKIEESALPWRPNIYYLGKQAYTALPSLLKGFDVCLMPFALNEATRHISPTKTLEYMAAQRPIVSTSVPDVVASWGDVVRIADGPDAFAQAIAAALREPEEACRQRQARAEAHLCRSSWDGIAASMQALIAAELEGMECADDDN